MCRRSDYLTKLTCPHLGYNLDILKWDLKECVTKYFTKLSCVYSSTRQGRVGWKKNVTYHP